MLKSAIYFLQNGTIKPQISSQAIFIEQMYKLIKR